MCIGMSVYWYECEYAWVFIGMIVYMCAYFSHTTAQGQKPAWKASFQFVIPLEKTKKNELFYLTLIFIAVSAVVRSDLRSLNLTGVRGRLKPPPPPTSVPALLISISCQSPLSERSPFISPGPASLSLRGFMCFCFIRKDPWSRHSLKLIRASKKNIQCFPCVIFFFLSLRDIRCRRDCRGHCKYFGCREKENIMIELAEEEKKNCS